MSPDSIDQLSQALGTKPVTDWHPPIMAIVWKVLLHLTGHRIGSMLILQLGVLWIALIILATYLYARTESRRISILPLLLGCMPFVVCISGVIWKDVQMAASLALTFVLLILATKVDGWRRIVLSILSVVLIVYATNLRYNSLFAVLPLIWLLISIQSSRAMQYGFLVGLILLIVGVRPLLGSIFTIQSTHPDASIMVDDVLHTYTSVHLNGSLGRSDAVRTLNDVRRRCDMSKIPTSELIGCATQSDQNRLTAIDYQDLKRIWMLSITRNPLGYASYRLNVYAFGFLQPSNPWEAFIWQDGTIDNMFGVATPKNSTTSMVAKYVSFTAFDFGFIFRPYFWLIMGIGVTGVTYRRYKTLQHGKFILAVSSSAVLYILSYIPLVAAYDYRYTYWAPLAVSLAIILLVSDKRSLARRIASRK